MANNPRFGELLTKGIKSIDGREDRGKGLLEEELGKALNVSQSAVQKWQQGQIPRTPSSVSYLAEQCVRRGNCDVVWLRNFLHAARHPQPEHVESMLFPDNDTANLQIQHNLPPLLHGELIGREDEIVEIKRYLSRRHRQGVLCISGQGGIGKTALALEIAHNYYVRKFTDLTYEERFDAIVFISAKKRELNPKRIDSRTPRLTELNSIFRELAHVLEEPNIYAGGDNATKIMIANTILGQRRVLLILDNLEDIDDDHLRTFLQEIPHPSKVLVTTRHRVDVALPVHLRGLSQDESRDLVKAESQRRKVGLSSEDVEMIVSATGGVPLGIVRTLGRMAWRQTKASVELAQLLELSDDYYEYVYARSVDLIQGTEAHKLFMGLTLFPAGATRDAIGYVAGLDRNIDRRDLQLSELEVLSLVDKDGERFSLNDPTMRYAVDELERFEGLENTFYENWKAWYEKWCLTTGRFDSQQYQELPNLLALLVKLWERQDISKLIWFFRHTHDALNAFGYWDERLSFVRVLVGWAVENREWDIVVEFFPNFITSLHSWPRFEQSANEWLLDGKTWAGMIASDAQAQKLKAHIAYCQLLTNKAELSSNPTLVDPSRRITMIQQSMKLVDSVYPIYKEHDLPIHLLSTLYEMACLLSDEKMYGDSLEYHDRALVFLNDLPEDRIDFEKWRAVIEIGKCLVSARRGGYENVREAIKNNASYLVHRIDRAVTYASLAFYELQLGNHEEAKAFYRKVEALRQQYQIPVPVCLEEKWWLARGDE